MSKTTIHREVECGICQYGKIQEEYTELKRVEHILKKNVQEQSKL